ncbi:MAG: hypothetical protein FIA99_05700 [Ruminiclostridium sp.]|nr:hypothetical protein [Ruminiclostridium sp.]
MNKPETYSYDLNGNMVQKTDRNGSIISMTYDGLNRLLANSVTNTGMPEYNSAITYSYTLTENRGFNKEDEFRIIIENLESNESIYDDSKRYIYMDWDDRFPYILNKVILNVNDSYFNNMLKLDETFKKLEYEKTEIKLRYHISF